MFEKVQKTQFQSIEVQYVLLLRIFRFVNFPLINLDLSNYVLNDNLPGEWKIDTNPESNRLLYDLFAVSNHEGRSGQVGHYTAFCK